MSSYYDTEKNFELIDAATPVTRKKLKDVEQRTHLAYGTPGYVSGRMRVGMKVLTPLHVGTGELVPTSMLHKRTPLRLPTQPRVDLIAAFYRLEDEVMIPGSSIKGGLRYLYEAVTHSCFAQANKWSNRGGGNVPSDLTACSYRADTRGGGRGSGLCPACLIFGGLGYQGQVRIEPARFAKHAEDPYTTVELVPARWTPQVTDIGKRKIYTHELSSKERTEPLEVLPLDSQLEFMLHFTNLTEVELGILLLTMGVNTVQPHYPKFGGGKAFALGAVELEIIDLIEYTTKYYLQYDDEVPSGTTNIQPVLETAMQDRDIFSKQNYEEVVRILGTQPRWESIT